MPGHGAVAESPARLGAAFPQPAEPMGEAWFMSARGEMLTQLRGDLTLVSVSDLKVAPSEIASGTSSFGRSSDERPDWFHHLLGRTVPRVHEGEVVHPPLGTLVTAFISQHPGGLTEARRARGKGPHAVPSAAPSPSCPVGRLSGGSRMIKALIFDVDGTLVDSVAIHATAWEEAFAEFGHAVPFEDIRGQIGKGGDELMPVFLSEDEIAAHGDRLKARRSDILTNKYLPRIEAFPQVRALFERLRADGFTIALASSAKGEEVRVYKERADIADLVETETSSDDAARSKPHGDIFQAALDRLPGIDPAEAVAVGDTPYDAQAAGKVGMRTIGVLGGGFPEALLRDAGCFAIYRDPADMLARYDALMRDLGR